MGETASTEVAKANEGLDALQELVKDVEPSCLPVFEDAEPSCLPVLEEVEPSPYGIEPAQASSPASSSSSSSSPQAATMDVPSAQDIVHELVNFTQLCRNFLEFVQQI